MALNVIHYRHEGEARWGVVRGDMVLPIPGSYATTRDFILEGASRARELAAAGDAGQLPRSAVEILCPITRNQQLVCQGINYRQHMIESGIDPERQKHNVIFRKASSCLAPANTDIIKPQRVQLLDYECELGLVLARDVDGPRQVRLDNLHEYVAALCIHDDVSARDLQLPPGQFYKGKSFRTFGPTGPYLTLVDAADLRRFDELHLQLSVNDESRQDAYAADLVFKPVETLNELFEVQDFQAGDLLSTGTPGGCALQAPNRIIAFIAALLPEDTKWNTFISSNLSNPRFLKPGDRVRLSIRTDDGAIDLGVQDNLVVAAKSA